VPRASAPITAGGDVASAAAGSKPETSQTSTPRNGGAPSTTQTAHLLAVYARLTPEEQRVTQLAATRMMAEVRAEWIEELCGQSVDEAVRRVRSMIPTGRKDGAA
jgi:hypothetical protein